MATTEERLAALEAKLAQLTDTTPTQYYTHQYSGEEIDAAVGRALAGGALDTSVTNVSNQLGTFVRPNLLDNWCFGNPVDQRKGYIQIGGTMMYKDVACTDQFGPSSGTTPVVVYATYARPIDKGVELALYIPLNNIVRGYTGNGYTVDRWIYDKQITISNGISLLADSFFYQKLEQSTMDALNGKQITFSALTTSNSFLTGSLVVDNTIQSDTRIAENNEFILFRSPWTGTGWGIYSRIATQILATKLELGPTQTLAHQENGVWVMNEVPDYGEQLRRCQRYFWRFSPPKYVAGAIAFGIDANTARAIIYMPEQMRTSPILNLNASADFFLTGTSGDIFNVTVSSVFTNPNSVCIDFKKSGAFEVNAPYFVRGGASADIDISSDL